MNNPRKIYREFNDEKLQQIRNHPYYKEAKENIIAKADQMLLTEPPRIRFSKMHLYVTTGDRDQYEADYFAYFTRLDALYLAYIITEDEKYLPELADTIWNICDFESWARPAHVNETASIAARRRHLALCSTGACGQLAEAVYFLQDKLPELVVRRAKAEIKYRAIDAFAEKKPPFCYVQHNWAAVCVAPMLCTYLYFATDEEIEAQLPAMIQTADNYLSGFGKDGCCTEGVGYWGFGFSEFLIFATMLKDYTDGKINYFDNPIVKKIAMFPYRVRLNKNDAPAFSDSTGIGYKVSKNIAHILKANYPDYPILENEPLTTAGGSRLLFCTNPDYEVTDRVELENAIFEKEQWFIYHGKDYAVGAKAGHNDEFHNHNDVGSFAVSKKEVVSFFDPGGSSIYDRQYFAPETRYKNMLCSSRGHSTPIINGEEQKEGNRGICELHAIRENRFTFDMKNAYVVDTLSSLVRDFDCNEEYFTLTDTYKFTEAPTALAERFVSRLPITLDNGVIKSGEATIVFDNDKFDVSFGSYDVTSKITGVIYYVDFIPKSLDRQMSFTFKFN